jgi:polar amino acid transport system substrate-binding protein
MLYHYLDQLDTDAGRTHCQGYERTPAQFRRWLAVLRACAVTVLLLCAISPARAQLPPAPGVPNFWDLQRRTEKPSTAFLQLIRFVTDDDYPPFGLTLPDGTLTGFNVELARAICKELAITCTVQARRFDTISEAITSGKADAAIASIAITAKARETLLFTHPYYRTPARFAAVKQGGPEKISPAALAGVSVGIVRNTAHAAFLQRFFPKAKPQFYADSRAMLAALKGRDVKIIFGDGVSLAIWLNGTIADGCCAFRGGPFTESYYFGEGVGIAVKKDNQALKEVLDYALQQIAEKGIYSELYLKYFPIGFY